MKNISTIVKNAARATGPALVALLISGCSDDLSVLNSVGTQLLRRDEVVKTDTLHAIGSTSFRVRLPMNGRLNLLGHTGGYIADEVLQWYPSSFAERDSVRVLSATITLRAETWFGDSSAPWGVSVYEATQAWGEGNFTWDSLAEIYTGDPGLLRGTYTGTIGQDTEFVNIHLSDTAMVHKWLQPTRYLNNYGIVLVPLNSGVVRGFHEFIFTDTLSPTLTVVAQDLNSLVIDTTKYSLGQDTFVGNIDNLVSRSDIMYVQSGVPYRSTLRFDCSSIPRGAIINQAALLLHGDLPASRLNRFSSDSAVTAYALTSATDSTQYEGIGSRSTSSLATSDTFRLDIRHQVQNWIRNPGLNYGMLIRPAPQSEFTSFDLLTLFNQNAQDTSKRPIVIVTYSLLPK